MENALFLVVVVVLFLVYCSQCREVRTEIVVTVNGVKHTIQNPCVDKTLLEYLRQDLSLTGAKIGCGEGGCGACSVVVNGAAINACLRLLCACDGDEVVTTEGLGSADFPCTEQASIADKNGSQCGYCTPGWVMAWHGGCSFDGNICRCTGYRPIVDAFSPKKKRTVGDLEDVLGRPAKPVSLPQYLAPTSLNDLLDALKQPGSTLVGGATATIGVSKYYDDCLTKWKDGYLQNAGRLVATKTVPELLVKTGNKIGSAVTLSELIPLVNDTAARHLKRVANGQVRNSATWAGNLVLAARAPRFVSDVLAALNCAGKVTLHIKTRLFSRNVPLCDAMSLLKSEDCVVCWMTVEEESDVVAYADKVAARHANAHAYSNCGLVAQIKNNVVVYSRCVLGSPSARAGRCRRLERVLENRFVDDRLLKDATKAVDDDDLAVAFVFKWFQKIKTGQTPTSLAVDRPLPTGTQRLSQASDPSFAPISVPRPKLAAREQACGQAIYVTDEPLSHNELHVHFALCNQIGTLQSIDASAANAVDGCVAVFAASDLKRKYGKVGTLGDDKDPLLFELSSNVFVGARVAFVAATSRKSAYQAAKAVACTVTPSPEATDSYTKPIVEASKWKKRLGLSPPRALVIANDQISLEKVYDDDAESDDRLTIRGLLFSSSTKHFHLETHAARAKPVEGGIEVWSSSQDNALAQKVIGDVLGGVPLNKITVKCRRAGGGFGGKLTLHLPAACAVAVVADSLGVSCRYHGERRDDMRMTGGREPCRSTYQAEISPNDYKLLRYAVDFTLDGGMATSDAWGSLSMAVSWSDNVYKCVEKHRATGRVSRSSHPRNTSMRSPGVIQSHCVHELAMIHAAHVLKVPVYEVQEANFYREGDETPYGNVIGENGFNYTIPAMWAKMKPDYLQKLDEASEFNSANKYRKRGVHMMPTKFVMGLSGWKIPAFVVVYADGSVEVTTGGAEIGQGLYTKVAAASAYALGCDISLVRVSTTSTDKVPNSTCTGGSGTSESACNAAMMACETIKKRLDPHLEWKDAVAKALDDNVELAATAWNDVESTSEFDYATYGVGVSVVEIDCLTGEVSVVSLDVEMDQGISLNSDLDLGQIEGGLVMALGFYFTEIDSGDGGTWEYKPPLVSDIPLSFNVSMLGEPNPCAKAVLRSKASGEPPMQLAACMYFAARAAIGEARKEFVQTDDFFHLPIPLTVNDVRVSCGLRHQDLTY